MKKLLSVFFLAIPFCAIAQFTEFHEQFILPLQMSDETYKRCDADGDGDLDLIAGGGTYQSPLRYTLLFNINDGNRQFTQHWVYEVPQEYHFVGVADVDQDGLIDVLIDQAGIGLSWVRQSSIFNFNNEIDPLVTYGMNESGFLAEDINMDGFTDICTQADYIGKVYYATAPGVFGNAAILPFYIIQNQWDTHAQVIDMEDDANPELFFAGYSESLLEEAIFLFHSIDGFYDFENPEILTIQTGDFDIMGGALYTNYRILDLDGNGWDDLVFYDNAIISWCRNQGGNSFDPPTELFATTYVSNGLFRCDDADNDGDVDIFYALFDANDQILLLNDGNETYTSSPSPNVLFDPNVHGFFDVDGDGYRDVIKSSYSDVTVYIQWGNASGIFTEGTAISGGIQTFREDTFLINDWDNDGLANTIALYITGGDDYALPVIMDIEIGVGNDAVSRTHSVLLPEDGAVWNSGMALDDVDGDGDDDIITLRQLAGAYHFVLIANQSNVSYGPVIIMDDYTFTGFSDYDGCGIPVADVDNDGKLDLMYPNYNGADCYVSYNVGDLLFSEPSIYATGDFVNSTRFADLDNDGDTDVLSHRNNSGNTLVYMMNGSIPLSGTATSMPEAPSAELYDMDGDGFLDVLFEEKEQPMDSWMNELRLFYQFSPGEFTESSGMSAFDSVGELVAGDFDLDGDADIVIQDDYFNGESLFLVEQVAPDVFAEPLLMLGNFWYSDLYYDLQKGDVDADGDLDLITGTHLGLVWYENEIVNGFQLAGQIFYDENGDGMYNNADEPFLLEAINLEPDGITGFSNQNGQYFFAPDVAGTYTLSTTMNDALWQVTTGSTFVNVELNGTTTNVTDLNFGFEPVLDTTIVDVSFVTTDQQCNLNSASYILTLQNNGTSRPSGIFTVQLDAMSPFFNASPSPDSLVAGIAYWSFDSLSWLDQFTIYLNSLYPGVELIGDTLFHISQVHVLDENGNPVIVNDQVLTFTEEDFVVIACSYDPNIKTVYPVGLLEEHYIENNTPLEYTVVFQNTGNAPAVNVRIEDELSEYLDRNTIEIVSWSHVPQVDIDENGKITFLFENIMLPDSTSDEPASHGFIRYRITPLPSLINNTIIENTAYIYFDSNPAVITNTVFNNIWVCEEQPELVMISSIPLELNASGNIEWFLNGETIAGATGSTYTPSAVGTYTAVNHLIYDCDILSNEVLITNLNEAKESFVSILPNPATDHIQLARNDLHQSIVGYEIVDATGRIVARGSFNDKSVIIATDTWERGVYTIRLTSEGKVIVRKIVLS